MKKSIRSGAIAMSLFLFVATASFAVAGIPIQNTDAQILGGLSVMDQNEIQAAQLAEQKNINHKISDYARMLEAEHNKHLDKTKRLSQELGMTTEANASFDQLRAQGTEDLAALTALDAGDFSRLYIRDVIIEHLEDLKWLDIQEPQNEQVSKFLKETRKCISMYLEKAQGIQQNQERKWQFSFLNTNGSFSK